MRSLALFLALAVSLIASDLSGGAERADVGKETSNDPRNIQSGWVIPDEGYSDQTYVVITDDGNWLCVLTTGPGKEGDPRQHVAATISKDKGKTWSDLIPIEPQGPPEASWVMPLKVPGGRVYAFYDYNGDNVRQLDGKTIRADMLGQYVFKYSDDNGRTWSARRYRLPVRMTAIDRANDFQGRVQMFWGVGKPVVIGPSAYFGFSKIGKWLVSRSEGFFFRSRNILTEKDPEKIEWEMLPDGEVGLQAPVGVIAEENNLVGLSDGSLYSVFRTVDGSLGLAVSRDEGRTWTSRQYATYSPGGRLIKNPRSPAFVRKFRNGKYLLLFHNHGGRDFAGRNPYWLSGGAEKDGAIFWSQPDICLYDDEPGTRIGYPDFIEDGGEFYVTETQKSVAHVHRLDRAMLENLWRQSELKEIARRGLVLSLEPRGREQAEAASPVLPDLSRGGGFAFDLWVKFADLAAGQTIFDTRDKTGKGLALVTTSSGTLQIEMNDGTIADRWDCDAGLLKTNQWHQVAVVVDGGPKIVTFIVDGQLCDGGPARRQGWHRFNRQLADVSSSVRLRIGSSFKGEVKVLHFYDRYLTTSECVGNYRAGLQ